MMGDTCSPREASGPVKLLELLQEVQGKTKSLTWKASQGPATGH